MCTCFDNYKHKILKCNRAKCPNENYAQNILVLHHLKLHLQLLKMHVHQSSCTFIRTCVHIKAVHAAGLNISLFYITFSSQTTDSRDFIYNIITFCFSNLHASVARTLQFPGSSQWLVRTDSFESVSCSLDNTNERVNLLAWLMNRLNCLIQKTRFVHESDTTFAFRSTWRFLNFNNEECLLFMKLSGFF